MKEQAALIIQPLNRTISVSPGGNLLDSFLAEGIEIPVLCNRNGSCGKCRVVVRAPANPMSEIERLSLGEAMVEEGYRLACKTEIRGSGGVMIPDESREDFLEGLYWGSELDALRSGRLPYQADRLPEPGRYVAAVDLGTTTLSGYLFDHQGELAAHCSAINPTTLYGSDIMSRLTSLQQNGDFSRIRSGMLRGVGRVLTTLCSRASDRVPVPVAPALIERVAFCGNTVMQHVLVGVDPEKLGLAPYAPLVKDLVHTRAAQVPALTQTGLPESADVLVSPPVWGFVGGDAVCGAMSVRLHLAQEPALLMDIGTNGELILNSGTGLYASSVSAGPAFEGYRIECGMRAAAGAIDRVRISRNGAIACRVVGDVRPKGLCGTGALSAVAALVTSGILTEKGHIRPAHATGRIGRGRIVLATEDETAGGIPIVLQDADVEVIQQAKAAFAAGIAALLRQAGTAPGELRTIFIAGSFGSSLDGGDLKAIGLIPGGIHAEVVPVGNAAGLGVAMMLLSSEAVRTAVEVARGIRVVNAASLEQFEDDFVEGLFFRHATNNGQ